MKSAGLLCIHLKSRFVVLEIAVYLLSINACINVFVICVNSLSYFVVKDTCTTQFGWSIQKACNKSQLILITIICVFSLSNEGI